MKVNVRIMTRRTVRDVSMSRVPCVGERIFEDGCGLGRGEQRIRGSVTKVQHVLDSSEVDAIITIEEAA